MSLPTVAARSIGRLHYSKTAVLICDVQEKFRSRIVAFPSVVHVSKKMISAAQVMNMPVIFTEQYPQGLGHTVPELDTSLGSVHSKTRFSMCIDSVWPLLQDVQSVILCGIEAHVCVLQTALDLMSEGKDVHVLVDGVSSQKKYDREFAFRRLEQSGAFLTTSQSALFMLARDAKHPKFSEIRKIEAVEGPDPEL